MASKGAISALDLGAPLAFYLQPLLALWGTKSGAPVGYRGPMAVSKGIELALDLGTPSCFRGPLDFDLGHQLSQGAQGLPKGPR